MASKRRQLVIGTLISLVLLGWVLMQTDWALVWARLREANYLLLAAGGAAIGVSIGMRAWRWTIMLEPEAPARPIATLFDAVNIGYLANNLLPARLGDLLRAYLAKEWTTASAPFALSTTVVERLLDTLLIILMLLALLPILPVPDWAVRGGLLLGAVVTGVALLLTVAAANRTRIEPLLLRLMRPLPLDHARWSDRLLSLLDGFALARQPHRLLRVLAVSIGVWGFAVVAYWLIFRAFGLDPLGLTSAIFVLALGALSMGAPSAPSAAGTFDAAATWALTLLGVAENLAGGVALVIHIVNFIVVTLLGLWSLLRRGLSLSDLGAIGKDEPMSTPRSPRSG
ncbi:MAG: flippase-like domain-containing protein [Anaerolineales bacterium]|nr:flippase-like domain-containing protein [Anaerolineales bacterium]MCB9127020.1 flippase-like domain-containing protein [Ardenticatenales bacterium]